MAPAIAQNPGHEAYVYCFEDAEPDVICAFQQYRSEEDAAAFLETDAYRAYEAEVAPLLAGPPEIRRLSPVWSKAASASSEVDCDGWKGKTPDENGLGR